MQKKCLLTSKGSVRNHKKMILKCHLELSCSFKGSIDEDWEWFWPDSWRRLEPSLNTIEIDEKFEIRRQFFNFKET